MKLMYWLLLGDEKIVSKVVPRLLTGPKNVTPHRIGTAFGFLRVQPNRLFAAVCYNEWVLDSETKQCTDTGEPTSWNKKSRKKAKSIEEESPVSSRQKAERCLKLWTEDWSRTASTLFTRLGPFRLQPFPKPQNIVCWEKVWVRFRSHCSDERLTCRLRRRRLQRIQALEHRCRKRLFSQGDFRKIKEICHNFFFG